MNPLAQSLSEGVRHALVAAFDPEQLLAEQRSAAKFFDRRNPDRVEHRSGAAREPNSGRRSTVFLQKVRNAHLIQVIESNAERLAFILKMVNVRLKVKQRQVPPGVLHQVISFALIEAEAIQYSTALEISGVYLFPSMKRS